jgi:Immunity protein 31
VSKFNFFEVVRILPSAETERLGIDASDGIVLGIADDEPPEVWYSILIGDRTWGVAEEDLKSLGRFVPRESIYDGTSIRADSEGRILPSDG